MPGDLKEIIGTLMRVLDGREITPSEVEDLSFEADGELQTALNEAYLRLLEFAYDCEAAPDQHLGDEMRARLQQALHEIVRCADNAGASYRSPGESRDSRSDNSLPERVGSAFRRDCDFRE